MSTTLHCWGELIFVSTFSTGHPGLPKKRINFDSELYKHIVPYVVQKKLYKSKNKIHVVVRP